MPRTTSIHIISLLDSSDSNLSNDIKFVEIDSKKRSYSQSEKVRKREIPPELAEIELSVLSLFELEVAVFGHGIWSTDQIRAKSNVIKLYFLFFPAD